MLVCVYQSNYQERGRERKQLLRHRVQFSVDVGLIAAAQRTDRSVLTDSVCSVYLCREALKPLKAEHFNGF